MAKFVGVSFDQFKVLWEYCAGLLNNNANVEYKNLSADDQKKARENAEERYLAYIFIQNGGNQHETLRRELQNDYTKGSDCYPKNRSAVLMFLDKYSKNVATTGASEEMLFAQKGKTGSKKNYKKSSDKSDDGSIEKSKDPYKEMDCFKSGKKGHPACFCPEKEDNNLLSVSSKSSKSDLKSLEK